MLAVPLASATVHVVDVDVVQEQPEGVRFFSHHVKTATIYGIGVLFPSVLLNKEVTTNFCINVCPTYAPNCTRFCTQSVTSAVR